MIVTCPGCGSKYRVRDEAVPTGGAELECPSCKAKFLAHPPKHSGEEIASAMEKLTRAKEAAEKRLGELDATRADFEKRIHDAERKVVELDGKNRSLEAQLQQQKSDLATARDGAVRAQVRAKAGADSESRVLHLTEELARAKALGNPELVKLREDLGNSQKNVAQNAELLQLVRAVSPMLWGLEQAIAHLESKGTADAALTAHVRQLQLLQAVLKKLTSSATS